jgi:acetyl-CoA C-acetyltransferase
LNNENIAIIGAYVTKFGEFYDQSFKDIAGKTGLGTLKDANLRSPDIDEIFIGTMGFTNQRHLNSLVYELFFCDSRTSSIKITTTESACASGSKSVEQAYNSIMAGLSHGKRKTVLVGGVEKMKDITTGYSTERLGLAANVEDEITIGKTFPELYAEIYDRYLYETGLKEEDIHYFPVIDHKNASNNPKAHYRAIISLDDVKRSPYIAEPLRLLECSAISDGGAAIIMAPESLAKELGSEYVLIKAIESDTDTISLHKRSDITSLNAAKKSANRAFKIAKTSSKEIWKNGVMELHDCFSVAGVIALEDLGFSKKGEGPKFIKEVTETSSEEKINPSGGLKAKGHPVGATGIAQLVELVDQLRGKASNQVENAEIGLAHNVGGTGGSAVITILGR